MSRTKKHKLTGGKAIDHSCRNNGDCPICTSNRTYKNQKREQESNAKEDSL